MEGKLVSENVKADISHIKVWLSKQPHLIVRTDDEWILKFLTGCKFCLSKTKEKLENFYTIKASLSNIHSHRDPFLLEIQEILKLGLLLPVSNKNGPTTFFIRAQFAEPSKHRAQTIFKTLLMVMDIVLVQDHCWTSNGGVVFVDLQGFSAHYLTQLTPTFVKDTIICFKSLYPARHIVMYVINVPPALENFINVLKSLLGKKLEERLYIYSKKNMPKNYDFIPNYILLKNYGGDGPSVEELTVTWKEKVESYRNWFEEERKYGIDETKRIVNKNKTTNLFGPEGSFRNLSLD